MIAFYPLGENAVLAEFGTSINETVHKKVRAAARILDNHKQQWMIEYIPAFTTIAVYYDPMKCYAEIKGGNLLPYQFVCQTLQTLWSGLNPEKMISTKMYVIDKSVHSIYNPVQISDQTGTTNTYPYNF